MSREWTPGDVGISMVGERFIVSSRGQCFWPGVDESDWSGLSGKPTESDRLLVVIDPEDREAVERLWRHTGDGGIDDLQYALRQYANPKPPRPDEPQGLGAVVEDEKGDAWVLINVAGEEIKPVRQWRTWWGNRPWTDIAAVRVLSPGVEVDQ